MHNSSSSITNLGRNQRMLDNYAQRSFGLLPSGVTFNRYIFEHNENKTPQPSKFKNKNNKGEKGPGVKKLVGSLTGLPDLSKSRSFPKAYQTTDERNTQHKNMNIKVLPEKPLNALLLNNIDDAYGQLNTSNHSQSINRLQSAPFVTNKQLKDENWVKGEATPLVHNPQILYRKTEPQKAGAFGGSGLRYNIGGKKLEEVSSSATVRRVKVKKEYVNINNNQFGQEALPQQSYFRLRSPGHMPTKMICSSFEKKMEPFSNEEWNEKIKVRILEAREDAKNAERIRKLKKYRAMKRAKSKQYLEIPDEKVDGHSPQSSLGGNIKIPKTPMSRALSRITSFSGSTSRPHSPFMPHQNTHTIAKYKYTIPKIGDDLCKISSQYKIKSPIFDNEEDEESQQVLLTNELLEIREFVKRRNEYYALNRKAVGGIDLVTNMNGELINLYHENIKNKRGYWNEIKRDEMNERNPFKFQMADIKQRASFVIRDIDRDIQLDLKQNSNLRKSIIGKAHKLRNPLPERFATYSRKSQQLLFQKENGNKVGKYFLALKKSLLRLKEMNLTLSQFLNQDIYPLEPFGRMGSREFLLGAKLGRKKALKSRLKRCKYHVYDFDNLGQTALHWAAKRNNPDICDLLMEYGANPNVPDLAGRTPVFVASKVGSMEALRALLLQKGNPLFRSLSEYTPLDVSKTLEIRTLLERGVLVI